MRSYYTSHKESEKDHFLNKARRFLSRKESGSLNYTRCDSSRRHRFLTKYYTCGDLHFQRKLHGTSNEVTIHSQVLKLLSFGGTEIWLYIKPSSLEPISQPYQMISSSMELLLELPPTGLTISIPSIHFEADVIRDSA